MVQVAGADLACYRRMIDPARFTLVHFHGNGEAVADYIPWMANELAALGLNSLFDEYREDEFLRLPVGDHNTIVEWNRSEYFPGIRDFVKVVESGNPS